MPIETNGPRGARLGREFAEEAAHAITDSCPISSQKRCAGTRAIFEGAIWGCPVLSNYLFQSDGNRIYPSQKDCDKYVENFWINARNFDVFNAVTGKNIVLSNKLPPLHSNYNFGSLIKSAAASYEVRFGSIPAGKNSEELEEILSATSSSFHVLHSPLLPSFQVNSAQFIGIVDGVIRTLDKANLTNNLMFKDFSSL